MKANVHPLDIVFRLAEDHGIVLLNGSGFAAPDWSVRISFANLDDHVYDDIGRALRAIARGYRRGRTRRPPARAAKPERPGRARRQGVTDGLSGAPAAGRLRLAPTAGRPCRRTVDASRSGTRHELPAERASRTPGAGDLPDARHRAS